MSGTNHDVPQGKPDSKGTELHDLNALDLSAAIGGVAGEAAGLVLQNSRQMVLDEMDSPLHTQRTLANAAKVRRFLGNDR